MIQSTYFTSRVNQLGKDLISAQKRYNLLSIIRLLVFVGFLVGFFVFWNEIALIYVSILFIVAFLFVVSISENAKYQRDKIAVLIEINKHEHDVIKGDWSAYDDGAEFKDSKHPYAEDLDLFGARSIFQYLNRTISAQGKRKLAHVLMNGAEDVTLTNAAIRDLVNQIEWCQEFMAEGVVQKKEKGQPKSLSRLLFFKYEIPKLIQVLRYVLPVLALISIVLVSTSVINGVVFTFFMSLILTPILIRVKNTNIIGNELMGLSSRVRVIEKQIQLFEAVKSNEPAFQQLKKDFFESHQGVVQSIKELDKVIHRFEQRMNLIVNILLNFLLAWDFQIVFQFDHWLKQHKDAINKWESQLAEIEVWISGAIFQFNHPESTFATFNTSENFEILQLGHPFVDKKNRVLNDVVFEGGQLISIITGPNMAGKSTYLRSLGLSLIFAKAGFPVLATKVNLPELELYTSMRTRDDVTRESSYFHAELTRLRLIMDEIEQGKPVFVILDEILKGTNSKDKEEGSINFLKKLARLKVKGVIATHDLALCQLSNEGPAFKNFYFDSTINGDELSFNYQIQPGVCQNMNASFLLKKMGLVDDGN